MKDKLNILILPFLLIFSLWPTKGTANENQDMVYIRPIKETCEYKQDGKTYKFFKDEWVRVKGENNGDIILGNVTLSTDTCNINGHYITDTDKTKKKSIPKIYFEFLPDFEKCFSILDTTYLIVDLTTIDKEGILRLMKDDQKLGEFKYARRDTLKLSEKGLNLSNDTIHYIPDSIPGGWIALSGIQSTFKGNDSTDTTDTGNDTRSIYIWCLVGFMVVVAIIDETIRILKKRKRNEDDEELVEDKIENESEGDIVPIPINEPSIDNLVDPAQGDITSSEKVMALQNDYDKIKSQLRFIQKDAENLQKKADRLNDDLEKERRDRNDIINRKINIVQKDFDRKVEKIKGAAEIEVRRAKDRAEHAEHESHTIEDRLTERFNAERKNWEEEKNRISDRLNNTEETLKITNQHLAQESADLNQKRREVEQLTLETRTFNEKLSGLTDSQAYCKEICELLKLSETIQSSASDLLNSDLSDPYFVYKALALFNSKLNAINMPNFITEVEMISKTGFVIKGTPLSVTNKSLSKNEIVNLTKNYFFTTYLKSFVDALVVLNESLAGIHFLIPDVKSSYIMAFKNYREQLIILLQNLGINVVTVHLFDGVGDNTDLLATEIDAGFEKHGAILEIENCKVSLIGGTPDPRRIVVKSQK